jgi:NADP-dependent 3-hydroxy acid dehydrogenase YdfG
MQKSPLYENVIIVTGASSGIGRELALQLADKGAWLSLAARDVNKLQDVAAQCHQRGAKAIVVPTDVTKRSQCAHLIEQTVSEYKRIDTLINNAGLSMIARFDEIQDLAGLEQVMQVNFFGSVYCTFYALPYLKATKGDCRKSVFLT